MEKSQKLLIALTLIFTLATIAGCCDLMPWLPWCDKKPTPTQTQNALRIHFSSLVINDDEEMGEGDWRIRCRVNGVDAVYVPKAEAGTGESVDIDTTFDTNENWSRVEVYCKIEEQDDSEWQHVGERTQVYQRTNGSWPNSTFGAKSVHIVADQGDVTLRYNISPL